MGHAAQGWAATPASRSLIFRDFEDGSVCFEPATCETRLLAPLAAFLLQQMTCAADASTLSHADIVERVLAADDSGMLPADAATLIDRALDELLQAGLACTASDAR